MLKSKVLIKLAEEIAGVGGRLLVVGGSVRDMMLKKPSKDIDVEVYNLTYEQLADVLSTYNIKEAGKAFSVIKFMEKGLDFDVALPRREASTGPLHTDFEIVIDPFMSPMDAAKRRDFTMNAMSYDPLSNLIIDPLIGKDDLLSGIIDVTSDTSFIDDPLRKLRAFQFISRFNLTPSQRLKEMAQDDTVPMSTISKERLWVEWEKWALSEMPDKGLQFLFDSGILPPELSGLKGTPQDAEWHPEGDVFIHTKQVVRMAAWLSMDDNLSKKDTLICVFSALCHDLGKPSTTMMEDGRIRSLGHSEAGIEPSVGFLKSIFAPRWLIENVVPLVKEHLYHSSIGNNNPSSKAVRKLSVKLEPSNINMWNRLVTADYSGRSTSPVNDDSNTPPYEVKRINPAWMEKAKQQSILKEKPKPLITGVHLIKIGIEPGIEFGSMLRKLYEQQMNGELSIIEDIMNQCDMKDAKPSLDM